MKLSGHYSDNLIHCSTNFRHFTILIVYFILYFYLSFVLVRQSFSGKSLLAVRTVSLGYFAPYSLEFCVQSFNIVVRSRTGLTLKDCPQSIVKGVDIWRGRRPFVVKEEARTIVSIPLRCVT